MATAVGGGAREAVRAMGLGESARRRHVLSLWRFWDRHGWLVLATALVSVSVCGFLGFSALDSSSSVATRMYLSLQLFTLESGAVDQPVPLALELARWSAPLVTALAAAEAVAAVLRRRSSGVRARLLQGHLVVVGLGERGWAVVCSAVEAGTSVVAIEQQPDNPHIREARRRGVPVVVGDARETDRLRSAGLQRADRLIVLAGPASVNAAIARSVVRAQRGGSGRPAFSSFIDIDDPAVMRELQGLLHEEQIGNRQELFNLEDRAGGVILDRFVPLLDGAGPVVVVGDTVTGLSVLAAAASRQQVAHHLAPEPGQPQLLRLVVPHDRVEAARGEVTLLHRDFQPGAVAISSELEVAGLDLTRPRVGLAQTLESLVVPPALVVVACDDELLRLRTIAALHALLDGTQTPVVVVTADGQGLVSLLTGGESADVPIGLFSVQDELCSDEQIQRGRLETMARALHEGYLRHLHAARRSGDGPTGSAPADQAWHGLPADLKEQNYAAAQAMWDSLRDEGFAIQPWLWSDGAVAQLPDDVVDAMAAREHRRWSTAKHPGRPVPPWHEVDPWHRQQSRDQVSRIPLTLAGVGLTVVDRRVRATPPAPTAGAE